MSTEVRPVHSPLGASGAERWMNCPGSVGLLKSLNLPESDEPEYRSLGTAAHDLADHCLRDGSDCWEHIGETFDKHVVDSVMAMAVQDYLDECRAYMEGADMVFIEQSIDAPEFHKDFYGTTDFAAVFKRERTLVIRDYKHGEGIAVDCEWNPQIMYYAYGLLRRLHDVQDYTVDLAIVQPRAFHPDGPIRRWVTTAEAIIAWAESELIAAMDRTAFDHDLDAGPWCRFCPAKLVCPLMVSLFGAAMQADPQTVVNLSDEAAGRSYQYIDAVKFYIKALEGYVFQRLNAGHQVPGTKLVQKRANRVFKSGAQDALTVLGPDIFTKPELKSPPEIEKLGSKAKELVKEWAYKPDTGLTVDLASSKKQAVIVKPASETFANATMEVPDEAANGD